MSPTRKRGDLSSSRLGSCERREMAELARLSISGSVRSWDC